ncbi:hypothetical protein [Rhizobium azibense]|uniref:hypothetical protein n=1 Tax=Rhizobium azibense TaxID=1136135 RepID=UPI001FE1B9AC|nr:hypothetical protein [Rhizobium azibense]
MVVPVLITNCHVSENWKNGPDTAHTSTTVTQRIKAIGLPAALAVALANLAKSRSIAELSIRASYVEDDAVTKIFHRKPTKSTHYALMRQLQVTYCYKHQAASTIDVETIAQTVQPQAASGNLAMRGQPIDVVTDAAPRARIRRYAAENPTALPRRAWLSSHRFPVACA